MSNGHVPDAFDPIPTFQQSAAIHPHPALSPDGIRAFRHRKTRVRIVHFSTPGPLVSATMYVGTEPISNAGHAHTLEHIIFLGSHNHPRSFLDNLACRCIANGTNAWTGNEHTAYNTTSAGFEGFAHLLPAFLDHVLRPRISEPGFASEVYHIRADGKEAGVVFCEMQARQNTEDDLSDNRLRAELVAGTPLQYDAGGLCDHIRHLTNQDVAQFHRDQYCTANVSVVVGGAFDTNRLLDCVEPILDEIASAPGFNPGQPGWQNPLKLLPLPSHSQVVVPFPCPDQDIGTVIMSWRGPGATEKERNLAIDMFLRYLCQDVWSPLRQKFVENEDQLASDIYFAQEPLYDVSLLSLSFCGVHHLDDDDDDEDDDGEAEAAEEEHSEQGNQLPENGDTGAHGVMNNSANHNKEDPTGKKTVEEATFLTSGDLQRQVIACLREMLDNNELPGGIEAVRATVKKERDDQLALLESGSHEVISFDLKDELVYGHRGGLIIGEETRGFLAKYESLLIKDESYWISLLRDQFIEPPRVDIITVPDGQLAEKLAKEETAAVAERVSRLGKEALDKIGKENEERIDSIKAGKLDPELFPPMPSTANISRWPYSVTQKVGDDFYTQAVTLDTDFIHCSIMLDTSTLTLTQRLMLPLLCELVPTCDVLLSDGSYIPYTDNSRAVRESTISTEYSGVYLGFNTGLAKQCVIIHFSATPSSFEEACRLKMKTFFQAEITPERVAAISQTLVANTTESMRDGSSVLCAAISLLPYLECNKTKKTDVPNFLLTNCLTMNALETFLSEEFTRKKPQKGVQRNVMKIMHNSLDALRSLSGSNVFVQVAAKDPDSAHGIISRHWSKMQQAFLSRSPDGAVLTVSPYKNAHAISRRKHMTLETVLQGGELARIIGISGVESSSLEVWVDSPVYEGHADYSGLTVLLEMLCRMEGPLANAVRGAGLAYGVSMSNSSFRGHLSVDIYESASPAAAWDAICDALLQFRSALKNPEESGLHVDLETSKAARLYTQTRDRSTPEAIEISAIAKTALGTPASPLADRILEEAVETVSLEILADIFDRHVARLLEPLNRMVVLTCGQCAVQEIIAGFAECSRPVAFTESTIDSLQLPQVDQFVKVLKKP